MIFNESKDYDLIEGIIKIPEIFRGFDMNQVYKLEDYHIYRTTDNKFLIGIIDNKPVGIIIVSPVKTRTDFHFAMTPYGHEVISSSELVLQGFKDLKTLYPVIQVLYGRISVMNDKAFYLYKKVGCKTKSYSDNKYFMELEL